jgi:hypothetical protein
MTEIGKPERIIVVEPLVNPVPPKEVPKITPAPVRVSPNKEPVPTRGRSIFRGKECAKHLM